MKKVLIIAHLFHASPRIPGLAKYLPEFGWQPVILTTPLGETPDSQFRGPPADFIKSGIRIIETRYSDVLLSFLIKLFLKRMFGMNPNESIVKQAEKKLGITSQKSFTDSFLTLYGEVFNYPDAQKGWKHFAVKAGSELLQNEDIDAMISSSTPVTSHRIAKELKVKHKIPWVADFRDLGTQNHYYQYGPLRKRIERRLELKTLLPADAFVTVSQPWAEKLRVLHRGKATYTITNGFDPDEVSKEQIDLTSKFTITYTGIILIGKHEPFQLSIMEWYP